MSFIEFCEALARGVTPPPDLSGPLRALWQDARGHWEEAHATVQSDSTRDAAWVHAYLHRKEGDHANAGYWYRRAGRAPAAPGTSLETEWSEIAQSLLGSSE